MKKKRTINVSCEMVRREPSLEKNYTTCHILDYFCCLVINWFMKVLWELCGLHI